MGRAEQPIQALALGSHVLVVLKVSNHSSKRPLLLVKKIGPPCRAKEGETDFQRHGSSSRRSYVQLGLIGLKLLLTKAPRNNRI